MSTSSGILRLLFGLVTLSALLLGGCFLDSDNNNGGTNRNSQPPSQPRMLTLPVTLSGNQQVPPVTSTATGSGTLQINLDTRAMSGSVTTTITDASMAHIHTGYAGENGPVLIGLENSGNTWNVPANTVLEEEDLEELLEGEFYVNVHSGTYPDGELRAQLLPEGVEMIRVNLTGAQEVPPVTTSNSAWAAVTLNHSIRELNVHLYGTGLDDATAAHLHAGFAGATGDPVIDLTQDSTDPAHWLIDDGVLTLAQYNRLRAAGLYLNVHTPAHADGEVRGQIEPAQIVPLPSFQINAQTPAANSTIAALPSTVLLEFNSEVDPASVDVGAFTLTRAGGDGDFTGGNEVAVNIGQAQVDSSASSRVQLDISGNAGPDDAYRLIVSDSLMSVEGASLDGDGNGSEGGTYQRDFTVTASGGGLQPTLSSIQTNIFTPICSVCHTGSGTAPAGLRLNDTNAFNLLVNVNSSQVPSLKRVLPGDPDDSYIIQKLEGTAAVGQRMPAGGPYLSQSEINVIRQWISNGALNN
ncbi:MAG TPA: CHRD domain-containing protein [Dongiaceae bacterium]|nr:CHRD domain-containing protein [Dongiaceae bacterium]